MTRMRPGNHDAHWHDRLQPTAELPGWAGLRIAIIILGTVAPFKFRSAPATRWPDSPGTGRYRSPAWPGPANGRYRAAAVTARARSDSESPTQGRVVVRPGLIIMNSDRACADRSQ